MNVSLVSMIFVQNHFHSASDWSERTLRALMSLTCFFN
eukprot:UN20283